MPTYVDRELGIEVAQQLLRIEIDGRLTTEGLSLLLIQVERLRRACQLVDELERRPARVLEAVEHYVVTQSKGSVEAFFGPGSISSVMMIDVFADYAFPEPMEIVRIRKSSPGFFDFKAAAAAVSATVRAFIMARGTVQAKQQEIERARVEGAAKVAIEIAKSKTISRDQVEAAERIALAILQARDDAAQSVSAIRTITAVRIVEDDHRSLPPPEVRE